jgi:hypothetical protein
MVHCIRVTWAVASHYQDFAGISLLTNGISLNHKWTQLLPWLFIFGNLFPSFLISCWHSSISALCSSIANLIERFRYFYFVLCIHQASDTDVMTWRFMPCSFHDQFIWIPLARPLWWTHKCIKAHKSILCIKKRRCLRRSLNSQEQKIVRFTKIFYF